MQKWMIATTAALGLALSGGNAAAQVEQIRAIGSLPVGHHMSEALDLFKQEIEENSEIGVDVFPASQLYSDADSVKVLPSGSVDVGINQLDFWMGLVPSAGILYMPTYYDSIDYFYALRESVTPALAAQLEEKGNVKLLGWADYDSEALISEKEIKTLEDFQGTKLRGYGQYAAAFLQAVGSSPVVMSSGEAYDALSKGVIDGTMSGPTSHFSRKFYEVASNLIAEPNFIQPVFSYAIMINLDTWNEMTPEQQEVVQAAADEVERFTAAEFQEASAASLEELEANGVNLVDVAPEEFQRIRDVVWPALEEKLLSDAGEEVAQPMIDTARELRDE